MKKCCRCEKLKDFSCYHKKSHSPDGRRSSCKECDANYNRQKRRGTYVSFSRKPKYPFTGHYLSKDYKRNNHLLVHYGITIEHYREMVKKQKGLCAICDNNLEELLCVDHDHQTGAVRGLLCHKCNQGIGLFKDNQKLLRRAIKYLNKALLDAKLSAKIEI